MITFKEACQRAGHTPHGILHVGAAMLEEAEQYTEMGVKTVWWIEARPHDPARMARAKQFGHTLIEGVAFGCTNALITMNVTSNEVSSSVLPLKRHSELYADIVVTDTYTIPVVRGEDILTGSMGSEVDTLVLDVQGFEKQVVQGLSKFFPWFKFVWSEVSLTELYAGQCLKPEFDAVMASLGFTRTEYFEVHQGEWGESFYAR